MGTPIHGTRVLDIPRDDGVIGKRKALQARERRARGLAPEYHTGRVAAEAGDIVTRPLHGGPDIPECKVVGQPRAIGLTKEVEPVLQ